MGEFQYKYTLGFRKIEHKNKFTIIFKYFFNNINILFLIVLIIFYSFFSFLHKFTKIVLAENKEDIFKYQLQDLSIMLRQFDEELAKILLSVDRLKENYIQHQDIFPTRKADLNLVINYFRNNKEKLLKYGLNKYKSQIYFLNELLAYKEDIYSLLGETSKQTYLILLENDSEKRPNGGFFGSFLKLEFDKGLLASRQIIDSYYPMYINPNISIKVPKYYQDTYIPGGNVYFISSNIFGFTDQDGPNIRQLYEKTFTGQKIRGIIFFKSSLLELVSPDIKKKLWEREFINASIDLIRNEKKPFKKELYIKDFTAFLNKNAHNLINKSIENWDTLLNSHLLEIYLTDISSGLQTFLEKNNLYLKYDQNYIYTRDYNLSYSKIDKFVTKTTEISDLQGNIVRTRQGDIIPWSDIPSGKYKFKITYYLNIDNNYIKYINQLEKKYKIILTDREKHIFGLDNDWKTRGRILLPKNSLISQITGDQFYLNTFTTPLTQEIYYKIENNKNNSPVSIEFSIEKK